MHIVSVVKKLIALFEDERLPELVQSLPRAALVSLIGALAGAVLCVLFVLVHLGFLAGSCSHKGRQRLFKVDALMLLIAAASVGCLFALCASLPVSAAALSPGIGGFALFASFAGLTVYDAALARIGIPVTYKQCYIAGIPAEEYLQRQASATLS